MDIFREYHECIDRFICSRTRRAFVAAWVLLATMLALVGAAFFWMGAPPMATLICKDTPCFLDGGWRIFNGQTPHKDFYDYLGDLPFYVAWLGMKLGRHGVSALTCGNVFVMAPTGFAAMILLQRRTSAFYAFMFSLFVALLAVAPRWLGDPHDYTCYAMIYNRYGEAFLALLGTVLFVPPEPALGKGWADWAEGGFAGFCLPLLYFCKLNYFAVGIGFFGLACLLRRFPVKQTVFGLLSAAAFSGLALILTKVPFSALCGDYRIMLGAQGTGGKLAHLAAQAVKGFPYFLILLLLGWEIARRGTEPKLAWRPFVLVTMIFGSEMLLAASNAPIGEMAVPLLALAALYGAEIIRRQNRHLKEDSLFIALRNAGAALVLLLLLLPTLGPDLESVRYSVRVTAQKAYVQPEPLRSTRLNDFRYTAAGIQVEQISNYMATVSEGIQLLQKHASPNMRLAVFAWTDPFQVALGLIPAKGNVIGWSWSGMSQRSHPPLERMVGNATHIMADRGCADIATVYGTEWADALHLEVVEQTRHFTLFKVPEDKQRKF
jgi:hypothetical protein